MSSPPRRLGPVVSSLVASLLVALLPLSPSRADEENVRLVAPPMETYEATLALRCPLCQRPCATQKALIHHVRYDHPVIRCEDCGIRCATPDALRIHRLRYHRRGVFPCPDCGTVFADADRLAGHRASSHGSAPLRGWPCRICGRSFPDGERLKRHREIAHPGSAPAERPALPATVSCRWCQTRLPEGALMDEHVRRSHPDHWQRRVRCPICNAFFPNGKAMELHLRSTHTELPGLRRKRCPRCLEFLLPEEWDEHMRAKHAPLAPKGELLPPSR